MRRPPALQFLFTSVFWTICLAGTLSAASFEAGKPEETARAIEARQRAVHLTTSWIRDPYIFLAPDGFYYLTGTTPREDDPRPDEAPYNVGLGADSVVGDQVRVWRSTDLVHWEKLGVIFTPEDGFNFASHPEKMAHTDHSKWRVWAPELHFFDGRWLLVHTSPTPIVGADFAVTAGAKLERPFTNPLGAKLGARHDPSLFRDDDKQLWIIWKATSIAPITADYTDFSGPEVAIAPADRKIGHEGCTIRKFGSKYVLFGTGWSTDEGRKGTYNLYYCTADSVTGPYGPRQFAGRFLGHGTPFQDKQGRWWCTAFFNGNVPPISREEARARALGDNAYTINEQGVTIVPLTITTDATGVKIHSEDTDYASPGKEEVQSFAP